MTTCPKEFLSFAHRLADCAGEVHRRYFRKPLVIDLKPDGSPVTQADRQTEEVLRTIVKATYPTHGIIGEEYPSARCDSEFVWLLDPIDGTDSFLSGLPIFGLLIALAWQGCFVLGLLDQAILRERWIAADGHGTSFNGTRVTTRRCPSLRDAVLYASGPAQEEIEADQRIARLRKACRRVGYGIECYTYGLLALGHLDLIVDYGYEAFEFAPLEVVVRNAGGCLTDWSGRRLRLDSGGTILAAGDQRLLHQASDHLQKAPRFYSMREPDLAL